jgi:hypothetical protein
MRYRDVVQAFSAWLNATAFVPAHTLGAFGPPKLMVGITSLAAPGGKPVNPALVGTAAFNREAGPRAKSKPRFK